MFSQLIGAKLLIINDAYNEDTKDQLLGDDGNGTKFLWFLLKLFGKYFVFLKEI